MKKLQNAILDELIEEAQRLLEPGEELRNPEYLRGICELLASVFGETSVDTSTTAISMAKDICPMPYTDDEIREALYPPRNPVRLRFRPQAWVNDYAVDVDPEGPTEWSVNRSDINFDFHKDDLSRDALRDHANAPRWVKDWTGPFEVELADPDSLDEAVCENCGQPCEYHPEVCLCRKCEEEGASPDYQRSNRSDRSRVRLGKCSDI